VSVVGKDGDGVLVQSIIDLRHNLLWRRVRERGPALAAAR
jgi:hypothetical protein